MLRHKKNLTIVVPITDKELELEVREDAIKQQRVSQYPSAPADVVLYEADLDFNLAALAKDQGYDFDRLVEFVITKASIELVSPDDFDMKVFSSLKLYVEDRNQLVAQADKVSGGIVTLKIVNGDLLAKFKEDNLHIILVVEKPSKRVKLKMKSSYKAKMRVFR